MCFAVFVLFLLSPPPPEFLHALPISSLSEMKKPHTYLRARDSSVWYNIWYNINSIEMPPASYAPRPGSARCPGWFF